jgi:hypothetical protein
VIRCLLLPATYLRRKVFHLQMKTTALVLLCASVLLISACDPVGFGGVSHSSVPYEVLGESALGQGEPGAPILAATSITQLKSLVTAHRPGEPAPTNCCWPGVNVSKPSLLLAFDKPFRRQCFNDSLSRIYLAGQALVVEVRAQKAACVSYAYPRLSVLLVAVALTELPHEVIEVRLDRIGDAEQRSHYPWDWTAVADLRQPLPATTLAPGDIQAGVDAAWGAMGVHTDQVSEVAVRRWSSGDRPCGLPTTKSAGPNDPLGVVVSVDYAPVDNQNPWVEKQHQYVWRVGQTSFLDDCGEVAAS